MQGSISASLKKLGSLEREIMEMLWDEHKTLATEVHEALAHKRKIAYTTVATVMLRLEEKGLLVTQEHGGRGRQLHYRVRISREEYERRYIEQQLETLFEAQPDLVEAWIKRQIGHNEFSTKVT